jgi:hypothetical protein
MEAVKAAILGAWKGKDHWGAAIKATFNANYMVTGSRSGSSGGTRRYFICGPEIHWGAKSGSRIVVSYSDDPNRLDGKWTYSFYSGQFTFKHKLK